MSVPAGAGRRAAVLGRFLRALWQNPGAIWWIL